MITKAEQEAGSSSVAVPAPVPSCTVKQWHLAPVIKEQTRTIKTSYDVWVSEAGYYAVKPYCKNRDSTDTDEESAAKMKRVLLILS